MRLAKLIVIMLAATGLLVSGASEAQAKGKRKKRGKQVPSEAQLTTAIGTKASFAPDLLNKLKSGMSPGEVKDVFELMSRVSYYGYSKAKVRDHKEIWFVRFHFDVDEATGKHTKLHSACIVYKPWLKRKAEFFPRMLTITQAKWGTAKDAGQVARKIITWANAKKTKVVQFVRVGDHYELKYEP